MIHIWLASVIKEKVDQLLTENENAVCPQFSIEHPIHTDHGDYSTNIAMLLAKVLRKSPLQIANEIKANLEKAEILDGLFYKITVAAPGFINFYVDWQVWALREFKASIPTKEKILIEHTSINPNKSAHIGHLRNSCIGDALAHMLTFAGNQVEVHNYIDDLGNQLADTVVGILHTKTEQSFTRFGDYCWETYAEVNQAYKVNSDLQEERTKVLHSLEAGHSNLAWVGSLVAEKIVREQLEEMKQFGIHYDVLVWESNIVKEGFWASAFALLQQTQVFHKVSNGKLKGCWVLKNPDELETNADSNFQADKVLVRSNGILTYTAKDIAYHLWKFGLLNKDFTYKKFTDRVWSTDPQGIKKKIGQADVVINVIDQRQEYPQTMVKLALEVLGFSEQAGRLKHVSYGVVSLSPETAAGIGIDVSSGKSAYAMSGRQGIGIKVSELLDQMEIIIQQKRKRNKGLSSRAIAAAAIRYYLLKYHLQTEVVFDLQQATEISGNSGVYLLYAHARAVSIMNKASKIQLSGAKKQVILAGLEVQEYHLLRQIAYWPESFQSAVNQLSPHLICGYAFELANLFNHFYSTCPILKAPAHKIELRIWLTQLFQETLQTALQVLGMPTPKQM
ncbi:arginine--tRNA ligase [Paenibacillus psychroresistens]|uniref:Arginine--tRNA ligase n=1 Tax=Paenibacillus psychroresistens TaxID=1778678 RepID=A0A6B8RIR8_9BACL|nr:arginine--tRNA ligase [Paenibacillus psychroresistens]QGQ95433.1 arginine--tRNA ligase [Paenibacillus psychroresistens]